MISTLTHSCLNLVFEINLHVCEGRGYSSVKELQANNWKVVGLILSKSSRRIVFSSINVLCWLWFQSPFHPQVTKVMETKLTCNSWENICSQWSQFTDPLWADPWLNLYCTSWVRNYSHFHSFACDSISFHATGFKFHDFVNKRSTHIRTINDKFVFLEEKSKQHTKIKFNTHNAS